MTPRTALLALALAGSPVSAQSAATADSVGSFVDAVRAATARYHDQAAAIADGYRRIGPDFPSMGEHWVSVPLVVRGEVDPLRPPILEYVSVDGRPVLAGVAYTQLVKDDAPRASLPAPARAWHYHAGSVDEESFILGHAEAGRHSTAERRPRVAVLHAWVWLENPAGVFATDNWALPWHRLGMAPPVGMEAPAPSALVAALAAGGRDYFLTLLRLRERLTAEHSGRVAAVLDRYARAWRERLSERRGGSMPPLMVELSASWLELEGELRAICAACALSLHQGDH